MSGTLFVVATPIGNLADLAPRARDTLAAVALIASEDTRRTGRLLSHIGVKTPQMALHEHNEARVLGRVVKALQDGSDAALVSDAGTPLISDPGYRLVAAVAAAGLSITPVPGPSAATALLSVAGLPTDRFCFEGFLPSRPAARREALAELASETRTMIFYESVHRIVDSVDAMVELFGADRPACLGRELSKLHEQIVTATLGDLAAQLADGRIAVRGEFTLAVGGGAVRPQAAIDTDALLLALADALPPQAAAGICARVTGQKKNALYKRLLELRAGRVP